MITRPTRIRLSERRRDVANFALKGWTQAAISRHMNIPQLTVSRDLAAMREFWREFPVSDFEKVRLERLQKSDLMTCIAQSDDVGAPKGRFCARREFLTELDASRNRIEICASFGSIFGLTRFPSEASVSATQVLVVHGEAASVPSYRELARAEKICTKAQ